MDAGETAPGVAPALSLRFNIPGGPFKHARE